MVPGKTYTPEDYVRIVWRRRWLLILPFVVSTLGVLAWAQTLPDRYRSEARILIVPQRVPENYVQPTITATLQERLQSINQQILSRTRLERIIEEFNLYPSERRAMIMEDVVARMRADVGVNVQSPRNRRANPGSFSVSYVSSDPRTAMRVAERLASLFITENLQEREMLAGQTSQFLEVQLADARQALEEHERKLEAFRRANAGELPSEMQSNLQIMQSTQVQLQAVLESMNRDRDRQLVLDRLIADAQTLAAAAAPSRPSPAGDNSGTAAEQLAAARAALANMRLRLTPEHPDVIRTQRIIADLERKAEREALDMPLTAGAQTRSLTTAELGQQKRIAEMEAERESLERRIAARRADEARLQELIATYRTRIAAAPSRESEQIQLTRDYDTLKQTYANLLAKSQASNIAADLERRQIGEQFRIIDGARLPERPTSPDRPRLTLMGAAAGLLLGLLLIALLEYRDSSLRTHDDVLAALSLPVLALVPNMITSAERAARRRRAVLLAAASTAGIVACSAVAVWWFGLLERWVR